MNSDRSTEIETLRKQKKLDRQAEINARKAKEAQELKSHLANMGRIAKKMADIESSKNSPAEWKKFVASVSPVVEEVVTEEPVVEVVIEEPVVVVKKKEAVKKPAAKFKGKPKGKPKGSNNK